MIDPRMFAFIGVAAVLTVLPGADMALVMRNVLAIGRPRTMLTIAGIACGCMIHATASALVMSAKVAIFYLTFLPQFIAPGEPVLRRSLFLAGVHITMGVIWLSAYAWFIDRLGAVLTRPRVKTWLERVTGGLLIALGARLAWERR